MSTPVSTSGGPNPERLVLTVDLGTGGPKVGWTTLDGRVLWWTHTPVATTRGPDGSATQDPEEWWRLVVDGARRGLAEARLDPAAVVACSVTAQWASTIPVDERGHPTGPCVMWMDERGRKHSQDLVSGPISGYSPRALALWLPRAAGLPSAYGDDSFGHLLHLQRDQPDLHARTRWYLEPADYLTMRFTGVPAATHASMTAAWLTDIRDLTRLEYDAALLRRSGIDPDRLPPLVPIGQPVGTVQPEVAGELGLRPDVVVVPGLPDLHGATVGAGTCLPGQAHTSIGTTGWVCTPMTQKKTDLLRMQASVAGLDQQSYLLANNQETAGRCLEWFRESLAPETSYDDLLASAGTSPAGAGGVRFLPWLAGERSPVSDRDMRGGFVGVGLGTTRADLVRAVVEGVALNTGWLLSGAEKFLRTRFDSLRVIGGGARSDLWCQVLADVVNRPVERPAEPFLTGLRGAALRTAVALGELGWDDVHGLVPIDRIFTPTPAHRATYDALADALPRTWRAQRGVHRRGWAADSGQARKSVRKSPER